MTKEKVLVSLNTKNLFPVYCEILDKNDLKLYNQLSYHLFYNDRQVGNIYFYLISDRNKIGTEVKYMNSTLDLYAINEEGQFIFKIKDLPIKLEDNKFVIAIEYLTKKQKQMFDKMKEV